MQEKATISFGTYLHNKLERIGMSIRKLAHECQYDPATISRLANGKQKPRPEHLVKIAQVLQIPVIELWQAAGYIKEEEETAKTEFKQRGLNFDACTLPLVEGLEPVHILAELAKYRLYAQTAEGQEIILQNFVKKLEQVSGVGPFINKLQTLYRLYQDEATDPEQKYIIGSLLLYFILPTDVIPDYLFPIGYLDDAMATDIVWQQIQDCLAKKVSP
ncbi:Hypothetical protein LUCI_5039 [Lucifera butyrica]|uniref:HTH cro/C1-type domain-containing protein n=1 Tax=Lucifera butyrica TaxID=1351585 RepID=A0A498RE25_9FIRM|nr:DUF1232 domain-containing protein [Lucifera butyrica]VBB09741.1 Hypothetical protein LUCI_5039 [Lucifera butyrica]